MLLTAPAPEGLRSSTASSTPLTTTIRSGCPMPASWRVLRPGGRCASVAERGRRRTQWADPRHRRDRLHRWPARPRAARRRPPGAVPGPNPGEARRRGPGATGSRSCRATSPTPTSLAGRWPASPPPTTWSTRWAGRPTSTSADRRAAAAFRDAAAAAGVGRIVYLGGLGDDDDPDLSPHLRSRHEVGRVLADGPVPVTELRAAVIIGSGQRQLRDAALPRRGAAGDGHAPVGGHPLPAHRHPRRPALARRGSASPRRRPGARGGRPRRPHLPRDDAGLRRASPGLPQRLVVPVPVLTPRLSSLWVGLVTPLPAGLAQPLVESLVNEVVVPGAPCGTRTPPGDRQLLPARPWSWRCDGSAELTGRHPLVGCRASRAVAGGPAPHGSRMGRRHPPRRREERDDAGIAGQLFATVAGIGGDRGWYWPGCSGHPGSGRQARRRRGHAAGSPPPR